MLKELHIRNWALAEHLQIEFKPHLNILTGETGAGKSILVAAIAAVLGGRVFTEVVRTGSDKAIVEAVFDISRLPVVQQILASLGIEPGPELLIRREISTKSSSRAFVNDTPVTVSTLAEIGDLLVDIHGQHEHQSLLRRETHRQFLDALGQLDSQLAAVGKKFARVKETEKALTDLQRRQKELSSQRDFFEFQFNEIAKANLTPGEDEALEQERKVLNNVEKLNELSAHLTTLFSGEDMNLLEGISRAATLLRELSRYTAEMQKLLEEFASAQVILEETARSIEEFQNNLEFDPQRVEEVEARLHLIDRLKKKYGESIAGILAYQQKLATELDLQSNFDFEIQKLQKQYEQVIAGYSEAAGALSAARREVAAQMEQRVAEQLTLLGMPHMRFRVALERQADQKGIFVEGGERFFGDESGIDQVEFYISPNPGEDFKPLQKIASGGEISRIMLALKTILAEIDNIPSLIFDEIDAGVSGRIAQAVGRSIANLAKSHQILCITHLPQIASQGNAHFSVEKFVQDGRTFTRILPLSEEQRVVAVAKLIAGETLTDTVLDSARQLIEEGRR